MIPRPVKEGMILLRQDGSEMIARLPAEIPCHLDGALLAKVKGAILFHPPRLGVSHLTIIEEDGTAHLHPEDVTLLRPHHRGVYISMVVPLNVVLQTHLELDEISLFRPLRQGASLHEGHEGMRVLRGAVMKAGMEEKRGMTRGRGMNGGDDCAADLALSRGSNDFLVLYPAALKRHTGFPSCNTELYFSNPFSFG